MKSIAQVKFIDNQALVSAPTSFNLDDGEYMVSIEVLKKKRSLDQNRYFWALLGEITKKENGDLKEIQNLYVHLLKMAGAKYEVCMIKHEALERFRNLYRDIMVVNNTTINQEEYDLIYAFYGSSKFNSKEMTNLIDVTLNYAYEVGVESVKNYWEGVLKNESNDKRRI